VNDFYLKSRFFSVLRLANQNQKTLKQVRSFVFVRSILIWVAYPRCTCRVDSLQIISVTHERRLDYFKRKLLEGSTVGDIHWRQERLLLFVLETILFSIMKNTWFPKKVAVAWCESNWKCGH